MAKPGKRESTAAEMIEAGVRPQRATERLRDKVLSQLTEMKRDQGLTTAEALQAMLPETILETQTIETLFAALLAGNHVLALGPPGSGKTTLVRELWDLYPKEVFVVADDPIHSDPFSVFDADFARQVPPSPWARERFGVKDGTKGGRFDPATVDPADVPVRRLELREGFGFARVQGSPEVFPDNLTGSINLARLEEIGDPTSPLVMEPGKVIQAHRGILLVDEVGKLPRGTQNVLLQALQEGTVSPAKTRETFPADIVAVTTSNLRDLASITEPLNDRLANVHTPYPQQASANRRIIDLGLRRLDTHAVAGPYRDAAVELLTVWRTTMDPGQDLSEIGSNRTLIDVCRRTMSYTMLSSAMFTDPDDFRRGALDAMAGRIRARSDDTFASNQELVRSFIDKHGQAAATRGAEIYWCRFFTRELKEDKQEGARTVEALRDALGKHAADPEGLRALLRSDGGDARVRRFAKYIQEDLGLERDQVPHHLAGAFDALDRLGAFDARP